MSTWLKRGYIPVMKLEIDNDWTLFLDRDGVINERIFGGYVSTTDEFHLRDDFRACASFFAQRFPRIIVVTNQQGVAKGIMTERNLLEIHHYMINQIQHVNGRIDHIFYAINAKGEQNDRRKPSPAMALEAKERFPEIDFAKSVMIGDTDSDIRFGKDLGMKTVLLRSEEVIAEKSDIAINTLEELKSIIQ